MNVIGTEAYEQRYLAAAAAWTAHTKELRRASRRTSNGITTDGCSSASITELVNWHTDAWNKIQAARACTATSCRTLVAVCHHRT